MLVKTKAIVISALKFQEKSLIVRCFTESDGLKSYFVRDAFSSRKAHSKIAYFQPLTILEIEAVHKNKGNLEQFKEIRLHQPFESVHSHIAKSAITMFLSEILLHSIREEEKNPSLFLLIETALQWLDHHDQVANFHLILLTEMTKHLGFYPEIPAEDYPFFEMTEGIFVAYSGVNSLNEDQTRCFRKLLELRFESNQEVFNGSQRKQLLKILIDYYSCHLEGFKRPRSLEVLSAVFS